MEELLQYCWKHKILPLATLCTQEGQEVEVIDAGLQNTDSGADFFNAKIKINGVLWVGNVEVHCKASQWWEHKHNEDEAYNNVILHVCETIDSQAITKNGTKIKQVKINVPEKIKQNYKQLLEEDKFPPCWRVVEHLSKLMINSYIDRLSTERLEQKTQQIYEILKQCNNCWETTLFVILSRNFGFGVNSNAFETWAKSIPLTAAGRFRDNKNQIEALFFGQSGLMNKVLENNDEGLKQNTYFNTLVNEYSYIKHKLNITPISPVIWKFLRLRPQNFPYIRISQLANLFCSNNFSFSKLIECENKKQLENIVSTSVSPFWQTHFTFTKTAKQHSGKLSKQSIDLLIINTLVPILFAYGKYRSNEMLCETALKILNDTKKENNLIVRMWQKCGLEVDNAAQSQALIQLKKQYCDLKKCLQCRIGHEYLKIK